MKYFLLKKYVYGNENGFIKLFGNISNFYLFYLMKKILYVGNNKN